MSDKELYGITISSNTYFSPPTNEYFVDYWFIKPDGLFHPAAPRNDTIVLARMMLPNYASNSEVLTAQCKMYDMIIKTIDQLEFLH